MVTCAGGLGVLLSLVVVCVCSCLGLGGWVDVWCCFGGVFGGIGPVLGGMFVVVCLFGCR